MPAPGKRLVVWGTTMNFRKAAVFLGVVAGLVAWYVYPGRSESPTVVVGKTVRHPDGAAPSARRATTDNVSDATIGDPTAARHEAAPQRVSSARTANYVQLPPEGTPVAKVLEQLRGLADKETRQRLVAFGVELVRCRDATFYAKELQSLRASLDGQKTRQSAVR